MARHWTVKELASYLRGLVDAGVGDAEIATRHADDNEGFAWMQGLELAKPDDASSEEPGILWIHVEEM